MRGRKPIVDREEVRDLRVTIRLSQAEYRYLQELGLKDHAKSVGEVLRSLALAGMEVAGPET